MNVERAPEDGYFVIELTPGELKWLGDTAAEYGFSDLRSFCLDDLTGTRYDFQVVIRSS